MIKYCFIVILSAVACLESAMIHYHAPLLQEWKEESLHPFDELMISWNAVRPSKGKFLFYVSVKTAEWSPWLLYATWGSDGQSSYSSVSQDAPVKVFQDALEVTGGEKATAFQIKIVTVGAATLGSMHGLHVYTNGDKGSQESNLAFNTINLKVPGLSETTLDHPRCNDLCSPTSTTAVVRYLSNNPTVDPVLFAKNVWDSGFDIFGNWVFNVAEAWPHLGKDWNCWVERLGGFQDIYRFLKQGTPVVVSVRGPLTGSAQRYAQGHLLVVTGYDAVNQKVLCMDPAFPSDNKTQVFYDLSEFIQAWGRRGNVAYVFYRSKKKPI